jgi:peptide/nickel transport system substrate-binding protein
VNTPESIESPSQKFSTRDRIRRFFEHLTLAEKTILFFLAGVAALSALFIIYKINESYMVEVPSHGGTLTEGIIGSPRFINPLLAISDADRDLTALIYSGLLKATPDGNLVPDLAKSYTISKDGLEYDFILRDDAIFQDGTPVTADDVIFTIQTAENPNVKSPKRADWEGIDVQKISDNEVKIVLKQPYQPFLENTTLGILPKHIWKDVPAEQFPFSEFNVEPIGSGPYKFESFKRTSAGVPVSYKLTSFNKYISGEPFIKTIQFSFFQNEETLLSAVQKGNVDSAGGISSEQAETFQKSGYRLVSAPLPRVFALFFNQNEAPILANHEVRQALNMVVDKNEILGNVLNGYGIALDSPIPPLSYDTGSSTKRSMAEASTTVAVAKKLLETNGWKKGADGIYTKKTKTETEALVFSITTGNAPELKETADLLKKDFEMIGAQVTVKVFEPGELNQSVIRPRKYDSLLFGEIVGRNPDMFAFWHSSQRNDPGLNIALYTNIKADSALERARIASTTAGADALYVAFENEVAKDIPAIFLYSPDYIYVVPERLKGLSFGALTTPSERFLSVKDWYVQTERVWEFFSKN